MSEAGTRRMGEEGHRVCRQGGCSLAPRLLAVPGVCLSTVKLSDCPILFCKSVKGFQECGFDVKGCGTKSALFEDFFSVSQDKTRSCGTFGDKIRVISQVLYPSPSYPRSR